MTTETVHPSYCGACKAAGVVNPSCGNCRRYQKLAANDTKAQRRRLDFAELIELLSDYAETNSPPPGWLYARLGVEVMKLQRNPAYRKAVIAKYTGRELPELLRSLA